MHVAAIAGYRAAVEALKPEEAESLTSNRIHSMVQRWAMDNTLSIWVQREAFTLLRLLSREAMARPRPDEAPVMMAVLSASRMMSGSP